MRWLILMAGLLIASIACAAPVTVAWDANPPEENVITYTVYIDGVPVGSTPDGATLELTVDISRGRHTITATASNALLESEHSDPLDVVVAGKPISVRIK